MDIKRNEGELKLFNLRVKHYREGLRRYDKRKQYIGTSLSRCVSDILAGYMPLENVAAMVSNTRYASLKDLFELRDDAVSGGGYGYKHKLTREPYPAKDWDKVFDHRLFNCIWIQHRITHGELSRQREAPHPFEKSMSASAWVAVNKKDLLKWVGHIQKLIK